jgi:hypothetical protein
MPNIEDLSRIRVAETIHEGLRSQSIHRSRASRRTTIPKAMALVIFFAIWLAITL